MEDFRVHATTDPYAKADGPGQILIYAPALQDFPKGLATYMIQLPIGNLNQSTARHIASIADRSSKESFCGVFALDPFTQWKEFLSQIRAAGFRGVCNYPSLPVFGPEEKTALVASGFSFESELEVLVGFAKDGIDVAAICPSQDDFVLARAALRHTSAKIVLAEVSPRLNKNDVNSRLLT